MSRRPAVARKPVGSGDTARPSGEYNVRLGSALSGPCPVQQPGGWPYASPVAAGPTSSTSLGFSSPEYYGESSHDSHNSHDSDQFYDAGSPIFGHPYQQAPTVPSDAQPFYSYQAVEPLGREQSPKSVRSSNSIRSYGALKPYPTASTSSESAGAGVGALATDSATAADGFHAGTSAGSGIRHSAEYSVGDGSDHYRNSFASAQSYEHNYDRPYSQYSQNSRQDYEHYYPRDNSQEYLSGNYSYDHSISSGGNAYDRDSYATTGTGSKYSDTPEPRAFSESASDIPSVITSEGRPDTLSASSEAPLDLSESWSYASGHESSMYESPVPISMPVPVSFPVAPTHSATTGVASRSISTFDSESANTTLKADDNIDRAGRPKLRVDANMQTLETDGIMHKDSTLQGNNEKGETSQQQLGIGVGSAYVRWLRTNSAETYSLRGPTRLPLGIRASKHNPAAMPVPAAFLRKAMDIRYTHLQPRMLASEVDDDDSNLPNSRAQSDLTLSSSESPAPKRNSHHSPTESVMEDVGRIKLFVANPDEE